MEITKPATGSFCWIEHSSNDLSGAKRFYADVFGWAWADQKPRPDGSAISLAQMGPRAVGALSVLSETARSRGVKPHWLSYVFVDDVDASAKRAQKLKGELLLEPSPVGPGRRALVKDPTGGVVALWHTQDTGAWLYGENDALGWNELVTGDLDTASRFYAELFGWKPKLAPSSNVDGYTVFHLGDRQIAGVMQPPPDMPMDTGWLIYLQSRDTDATAARARGAGAKLLAPPADIPKVGRYATLSDPFGAMFGLLQPARK